MEPVQHIEQNCGAMKLGHERSEWLTVRFVLVLKAYFSLIRFDLYLKRKDFTSLYNRVRNYPTGDRASSSSSVEAICSAVDMACIWYWKEVRCLQRSAATTCLLKQLGVSAQLVLGVQQIPFKAHAWVEVEGNVVNDKAYVREMYSVLERC